MFELILRARDCVGCGICADVCPEDALALRPWRDAGIEGLAIVASVERGTWPWMAAPSRCTGCNLCVDECPVSAIDIEGASLSRPRDRLRRSTEVAKSPSLKVAKSQRGTA